EHRHRPVAFVRLRGRGHRRPGIAVGHLGRRHHPRCRPADRSADQLGGPDPGRIRHLPCRARRPAAWAHRRAEQLVTAGTNIAVRVTRSRRPVAWTGLAALAIVAIAGYLPYLVYSGTTDLLVNVFTLMTMATMWNLLAGYAGLVSVGQQAFIGLG